MSIPLTEKPHLQPVIKMLKRDGWAALLLAPLFIRGMHGLPAAFHSLFFVRKSDIQSYEMVYSRHDLWVLHSGLLSLISAVLFICIIVRWIRFYLNTSHSAQVESDKTK